MPTRKRLHRRFRRQVVWHEFKAGRLRMAACIFLLPEGYELRVDASEMRELMTHHLAKQQQANSNTTQRVWP